MKQKTLSTKVQTVNHILSMCPCNECLHRSVFHQCPVETHHLHASTEHRITAILNKSSKYFTEQRYVTISDTKILGILSVAASLQVSDNEKSHAHIQSTGVVVLSAAISY